MIEIKEKVQEMIAAPSCCAELKEAGQAWLNSVGTDQEAVATEKLLTEIEEDLMPINGLIAFAGSETGAQVFGKERAAGILAHAKEVMANGGLYCDCPACSAALAIKNMLK